VALSVITEFKTTTPELLALNLQEMAAVVLLGKPAILALEAVRPELE
jgi:hypothetical protein